ncbi:agmatine deiminase family protein [Hyphococcus flavus]|uniref:Agmatine deiminase family protein n=1 Tax=Hyphococcus flavus TaxID=1866326 RepID=A0AAF0CBN0_9PROT|nr:agmatine deiminase family protein [Hyphococcus flavus]WDI31405.1 agmatine deiminase family protein [Hyphococcus flavus]
MYSLRRQPAEWERHDAVWIGWPSAPDLWENDLGPARAEVEDFIRAILFPGGASSAERGERVNVLANGREALAAAEIMRSRLPEPDLLTLHDAPIGDIWLRDTGPIFVKTEDGALAASAFSFNGWGGKYLLPSDEKIAEEIARFSDMRLRKFEDFIGEGGALETDGEGTFLTTRQCLLNRNRNPNMSERDVEEVLKSALGAAKVIWLDEGLEGDHTDGHIDNLARFIAPGKVVCMRPTGNDDPNAKVLGEVEKVLSQSTNAGGSKLEVITIPSPGRVLLDGEPAAASHMNFYISNNAVIMPCYGALSGHSDPSNEAIEILKAEIDRPHFFAIDSSHILTGGGSFHCISQQQPPPGKLPSKL